VGEISELERRPIIVAQGKIPNLFPQSEPAQISSINLSCLTVLFEKLYIISLKSAKLLYIVIDRCIVILYCMFLF